MNHYVTCILWTDWYSAISRLAFKQLTNSKQLQKSEDFYLPWTYIEVHFIIFSLCSPLFYQFLHLLLIQNFIISSSFQNSVQFQNKLSPIDICTHTLLCFHHSQLHLDRLSDLRIHKKFGQNLCCHLPFIASVNFVIDLKLWMKIKFRAKLRLFMCSFCKNYKYKGRK